MGLDLTGASTWLATLAGYELTIPDHVDHPFRTMPTTGGEGDLSFCTGQPPPDENSISEAHFRLEPARDFRVA